MVNMWHERITETLPPEVHIGQEGFTILLWRPARTVPGSDAKERFGPGIR
jgi:hypothetical protein